MSCTKKERSKMIDVVIYRDFLIKTDKELSLELGICENSIQRRRYKMRLKRPNSSVNSRQCKAMALELFSNGITIQRIAKMLNKTDNQINYIIDNNFFFKKRSYDTITLVMDSKMNYETNKL